MLHQFGHGAAGLSGQRQVGRPKIYLMLWNLIFRMMAYLMSSVLCVEVIAARAFPPRPFLLEWWWVLSCRYQHPAAVVTWDDRGCPEAQTFICQGPRLGSGQEAAAGPASPPTVSAPTSGIVRAGICQGRLPPVASSFQVLLSWRLSWRLSGVAVMLPPGAGAPTPET